MKRFYFIFLLLLLSVDACLAQNSSIYVFHLDQLPPDGVLLDKGWKFQAGDNPEYSKPGFDDQYWKSINPTKDIRDIPELWKTNIGWFRLHFIIDTSINQQAITVLVEQTGASEIFLNGQLIQKFGTISNNPEQVQAVTPTRGTYIALPVNKSQEQVLAVRFALQKHLPYIIFVGRQNPAFALQAMEMQSISHYFSGNIHLFFDYMRGGVFFILSILHLALFLFNPSQKANLYFFTYAILSAAVSFLVSLVYTHVYMAATRQFLLIALTIGFSLTYLSFLSAAYKMFDHRRGTIYWLLVGVCLLSLMLYFIDYHEGHIFNGTVFPILIFLEITRVTMLAVKSKRRGAKIVVAGAAGYLVSYLLFLLFLFDFLPAGPNGLYAHLAVNISFLIVPIAISIYLALESSFTSHLLTAKLDEVQKLSQQTVEQEKEKQQILTTQKETLEQQVQERTAELKQSLEHLKSTQAQLIQSEKMASLGELTAGIAHEIQNPLNFVNNFSEVSNELLDEMITELGNDNKADAISIADDVKQNLEKILHHGKQADGIVKGMLQHSRSSSAKKEPTDINKLADEYLRLAFHGLRAKDKSFNAVLKTDYDETIGTINIIPQDIGRVILNLINNAFHAISEKKKQQPEARLNDEVGQGYEPSISVSTKKIDSKVSISVKDNGNGISPKILDKIFQPFFTTKPTGQGTGLGLSLSYDIIKAHGGELKVETVANERAVFTVVLPAGTIE